MTTTKTPAEKLSTMRSQLRGKFLERTAEIDGLLCAMLARHHVLLLGPPGEAKSALASVVTDAITGADLFQVLLTKTTTPEEICGPLDLPALEQGHYRRKVDGYLPTAHIAYIDETFKGSSAILNTMLTALNERSFDNDGGRHDIPLMTAVGASNELPDDRDLGALYDRFLLRYWVEPVKTRSARRTLLQRNGASLNITETMTLAELETAIEDVEKVTLEDTIVDRLLDIREALEDMSIVASDRRWIQIIRLLKARAYLDGCDSVETRHLSILCDCLWKEPKERSEVVKVVNKLAHPVTAEALEALDAAESEVEKVPGFTGSNHADVINGVRAVVRKLTAVVNDLDGLPSKAPESESAEIDQAMAKVDAMISAAKAKAEKLVEL